MPRFVDVAVPWAVGGGSSTAGLWEAEAAPGAQAAGPVVYRAARLAGDTPSATDIGRSLPRPVAVRALVADTPVKREKAVEYSDWYARRLAVHRVASYTMLPLFAMQYYTGTQLLSKGADAPRWVIRAHGPLATATAVVFSVNTVTGVWNLLEARKDPSGRFARTLHGVLMLAADAGFTTAGYLSKPAESSSSTRRLHRTVALSSMGTALFAYAIMLPPFRR